MCEATVKGSAVTTDCGVYRYHLTRVPEISEGPIRECVFIMLNPSTADADEDDPTVRRCRKFMEREGCNMLSVVNLFAYRSPSPEDLKLAEDPVGPKNDGYLARAMLRPGPVIAAWGNHGALLGRDKEVVRIAHMLGVQLKCFKITKQGAPTHPLYVPGDQPLEDYG